ncbi:MAG: glycosyltransferase family 4 protein [Solirubrobacteraceae bacterium]
MTLRTLLVGPAGHGGEGVFMTRLRDAPPDGVDYVSAGDFHAGAPGAPCEVWREVLLNQVVHRLAVPDMGIRALRLREPFDLVHVHGHPVRLRDLGSTPLVMSEGSSAAVYAGEYLGWDDRRLARAQARSRQLYRAFGIADRLLALERAKLVFVFSRWARDVNLRCGADPDKLRVLTPGFPDPGPLRRGDREGFTFLFVGGDFERKGGFEVLEALDMLRRDHAGVRLVLAGSNPTERNPDRLVHSWVAPRRRAAALELLAELERAQAVRRIPWVAQAELRDVYRSADAFVMPTHAEGFGFTNVEAMSFGLPVITSTAGPAAEIVADGETGMLVAPGNAPALHEAMARMVGDPVAARRMGEAGRTAFLEKFTLDRFRAGLRALYLEATAA